MQITHVIRGAEWLSTFPLHGHIHRAFGWTEPEWVHLSIFLKPSGKGKMSKREAADLNKDGYSIFIKDLEGLGYLPEAVINWITLMGWSYDDHTELFSMQDLIEKFTLEKLNPSPAAINFTKLDHFNGVYIRSLSAKELAKRVKPFLVEKGYQVDDETLFRIAPLVTERLATLDEIDAMAGFFFLKEVNPDPEELIAKGTSAVQSAEIAEKTMEILTAASSVNIEVTEPLLRTYVESSGYSAGQVFGIMRVAITGQKVSPPLFESMEIIGKETCCSRLGHAISLLQGLI
jgi:glutamyl-tRNA synthetase